MGLQRRLALGFKPRHSSQAGVFWDHVASAKVGTVQLWGAPFLPRGLGCRRDFAWKKRGERTLAGGL